jgi:hypothetical protein
LFGMTLSRLIATGLTIVALAAAACSKDNPTTPTTTCTFSVATPAVATFPPEGGTTTAAVTVTAGNSCTWTATSNANFITITQGATGTGNGTVAFTIAANSGAERSGTLTIAGTTVTITQRAATTPSGVTLSAPTPRSPTGNQESASVRPALIVDNAVATGNAGTVTYRFEISDLSTLSDPARIISVDGIPQGTPTTSWTVDRDLAAGTHYFWRARATNGTVTSAYSNIETFTTPGACGFTLSTSAVAVDGNGGTAAVNVSAGSGCSWTAVSNAPFITVTAGASGTANGTVTLTVAPNTGGAARSGTVTVAGQTVTVNQTAGGAGGLIGSFRLIDPGRQPTEVGSCHIRSLTGVPTQCILESTSVASGTNVLSTYTWTVSYNYPSEKAFTQTGTNPRFSFTELCGQAGSNDSGVQTELFVTLNVIDSAGNSVTVRSNAGSQPQLTLRAYTCGI